VSDEIALNGELTRASAKLERQVDVCSANGTGVRGTGRAQDIAGAGKSKGLKRQLILTSASIYFLFLYCLLPSRADIEILLFLLDTITLKAFT
jgi:hypothetical protein